MRPNPILAALLALLAACAAPEAGPVAAPDPAPGGEVVEPAPTPAPWSAAPLPADGVPAVYHAAWRDAENRDRCALLAPADIGAGRGATPRRATFSGGWAVGYDLPQQRSAFGVAGTGSNASEPAYEWPSEIRWDDGSRATYGPEGGTGPNELAYLRVAGQGCLYNVWSRLGRDHLEHLLAQLRRVEPAAAR